MITLCAACYILENADEIACCTRLDTCNLKKVTHICQKHCKYYTPLWGLSCLKKKYLETCFVNCHRFLFSSRHTQTEIGLKTGTQLFLKVRRCNIIMSGFENGALKKRSFIFVRSYFNRIFLSKRVDKEVLWKKKNLTIRQLIYFKVL